ncbi:IS66-like element accessory protein TnpA [Paracraurococcus ruber]|uniref:IS66-like element accessory protein TnpA n=1 Tax=Paracraurococcus ruber TaxID=77675 RepID=UPI00130520D8|nr:transposase [Paracraurococcus ruber]
MPDGRLGEVISVVARRRRWTLEQKLALVEEVSRPGASVAAVADRHGMSRSLLFEWRRQVREGTMPGVVRAEAAPALVPVRVVEGALPKEPSCPPPSPRGSGERAAKSVAMVEVVLSNGRVLRVSEAIRPEVLGRLAAALDV